MKIIFIILFIMILYGVPLNYVDVTDLIMTKGIIQIPASDFERAELFGDPAPGVLKHIKIKNLEGIETIYPVGQLIALNSQGQSIPFNYKYYLSVVTTSQNDERFLAEWLEFHLLVGVQHFYILDNNHDPISLNATLKILQPYIDRGLITHVLWSDPDPSTILARDYGFQLAKPESQWVAMIDTDEFIVPNQSQDLKVILTNYESYAALTVNWQMFGTSGIEEVPLNQLMIQCLNHSLPNDQPIEWQPGHWYYVNTHIKSILNSNYTSGITHAHYGNYIRDYQPVNSNYEVIWGAMGRVCIDQIQINHYFFRDLKFSREVKLDRRRRFLRNDSETLDLFLRLDNIMSSQPNVSMNRFIPQLKTIMTEKFKSRSPENNI